MSIQTQIDRISGNVSAALAAIAEKGVTVPDGSTSDALAELIASIEAGGSAPGFAKVATGTITPSSTTANLTVEHGLGQVPDAAIIYSTLMPAAYVLSTVVLSDGYCSTFARNGSTYTGYSYVTSYMPTETAVVFQSKISSSSNSSYPASRAYRWIAGVYA